MVKIINDLWSTIKTHAIYILIICLLCGALCISINKCSSTSGEYKHNIEALKDTIRYYQDKNGNLVATKLAFESDINTLKVLNEDLYNQIDSMKLNPNVVNQIIYVGGEIENPQNDTSFVVNPDTLSKGFTKDFEFNNKYRVLEGNVDYHADSLGVHITKDITYFDYTVVMDDDARIYVKSTNPYVKYNEITGFTVPQPKRQWTTFVIGPSIGYSYDIQHHKFGPTVGLQLTWGLNLIKQK